MTKSELQEALSTELNLPLDTAKSIIATILDSLLKLWLMVKMLKLEVLGVSL